LNPRAGPQSPDEQAQQVMRLLDSRGPHARVLVARTGTEIVEFARRAVCEEVAVVVAAGGDGTVSAVASVLAGTNVPLGVLPVGTLNHFAKDLQIPMDLEGAVRTIKGGRAVEIDVCEVNGRVFINNSSLGLYPTIVREREFQQRMGYGKWPAFVWAALLALRRYPFLSLRLEVDGRELLRSTPFVFIGNNIYHMEGLNIGSRASLQEGQICIYILRRTGRAGLVLLSLSALRGRLRHARNFDGLCAREVWIETRRRRVAVAMDGEVFMMESPLHYRMRARALRVMAP
ncbi:MAG: diacylglycerol kinase family lipid kinase, partial [Acidobacteria bacterium]|nr:diacylglycerol kinase family lipid kinase [Acidobacteriota bacterium]